MTSLRPIPGVPSAYLAGVDGRIYSTKTGLPRVLTGFTCKDGYRHVSLRVGGKNCKRFPVHRLVALAFHGEPASGQTDVRHLDGKRSNNEPSNLAWGTRLANGADTRRHGSQRGDRNPNARLTREEVRAIRDEYARGAATQEELAAHWGIGQSQISRIVRGEQRREEG